MWFKLASATFSTHLGSMAELSNSIKISYTGLNNAFTINKSSVSKDDTSAELKLTLNSGWTCTSASATVTGATETSDSYSGGVLTINIKPSSGTTFKDSGATEIVINITHDATSNSTGGGGSEGDEPTDPPTGDTEYISYIGSDAFSATGVRVQAAENDLGWIETTSGTTSAATDYLPVSSEDSIWIEYIAVVNNGLASGGFYDMNKNLVAPLYWGTFGIDQAANASAKFVTPENPVTIASVEEEWNCTIAYIRFIAWSAADGNNTGLTNTEARIYYANGEPAEPTYTSYIGEDVFSFNRESFTNTGYTTSGSSSAYASDYLAVTPEQGVWLQYIFTMSDAHRCVGLFDSNKTFIKSLTAADFGLSTSGKFQTPGAPVKISSLDGTENVAYVRFVAWDTSDGGRANTEARIYSY